MKLSTGIALTATALLLIGCSATAKNVNIKPVKCRGYIEVQSIAKELAIPLTKYNTETGKFYSPGHGIIGMMGWHSTAPFSKIVCLNTDPRTTE
ncbi:hypothetical protein KWH75_06665 [Morganella morganii]|uniref:hypothetical protein n=1 Tax=Morganella morganii TaxID=582 RepID=UPI0021CF3D77|nr:hypothetical protein [Morganella morganii]MCU6236750.1 hypothetical protein [Morganella morganii]